MLWLFSSLTRVDQEGDFRVQWGLCPCTATLCVIVLHVRLSASNEDVNVVFLLHLSPTCVD